MKFHVITLFPNLVSSYLKDSILARAKKQKKIEIFFYNPRDFVKPNKSQKGKKKPYLRVDDKPFGGGPGMVMQALPVVKAIETALSKIKKLKTTKIIFFTPSGKKFDTFYAKSLVRKYSDIIMICGRYEGIDVRVKKIFSIPNLKLDNISVGDYVLTGGEIPAMVLIDSISRQVEGVLGNFNSREEERVSSSEIYTRPEIIEYKKKKYKVPKVLLSGDHKKIEKWKSKSKI